jgi:hypothetical protein
VLLSLLPFLNAFTTSRPLWHSLIDGDRVFAGIDLMCFALAALHAVLALRVMRGARSRNKARSNKATVAASEGVA